MAYAKTVIFDYIGTLVNCKGYSMDSSIENLYSALIAEGFDMTQDKFLEAYTAAHEKYQIIRYEQLREVTNAVWVAEALQKMGFDVTANDNRIRVALNVFFKTYVETHELRADAKKLLKHVAQQCKIGLVSNFTYAPVIYSSLRKLGIGPFFDAVVVSEENGWRKPSRCVFQDVLDKLQMKANEAVFIGDSPIEDIKGAKQAGLRTVFVPSQFNTLKDLVESKQEPDFIAKDLLSIIENLPEIINIFQKNN